jgi:hypothetical protein
MIKGINEELQLIVGGRLVEIVAVLAEEVVEKLAADSQQN